MAIRKNTRRFDPRYFLDEKTDIIEERVTEDPPKDVDPYERPLESPLAAVDVSADQLDPAAVENAAELLRNSPEVMAALEEAQRDPEVAEAIEGVKAQVMDMSQQAMPEQAERALPGIAGGTVAAISVLATSPLLGVLALSPPVAAIGIAGGLFLMAMSLLLVMGADD